jgi:hypothetical protein
MKLLLAFSTLLLAALALSGCATYHYAHGERYRSPDSTQLMSKADVIALSSAGVSDRVIIGQIQATGSMFDLSTQDIIDLANAGVSDTVISMMVRNDQPASVQPRRVYGYSPYYTYLGYPFWYPWYSPFYSRFSIGYDGGWGHRFVAPRNHWGGGQGWHRGFSGGHGGGPSRGGGRHR